MADLRPLRIMTYNVRYFGHALRGLASTRASKRGIAEALADLNPPPDIICMQEVDTISLRSSVAFRRSHPGETQLESFMGELERAFAKRERRVPYEAFYFRAHRYGKKRAIYTTGLVVLVDINVLRVSGHNVDDPHHITHHRTERWKDTKQTRICAHMQLRDAHGRPFHLFNTHLSLPTPFVKQFWSQREKMGHGMNQVEEARSLVNFVRERANADPFVICGDFNSPPGSPVFRFLTEEAGLSCAQKVLGQIDGETPRAFPTAGVMRLRMHLDHLFSGGAVRWLDLDGTQPYGKRSAPFFGLSDHMPLIARFAID